MAVADAAARAAGQPLFAYLGGQDATLLPIPETQIIGGGAHANWRIEQGISRDVASAVLIKLNQIGTVTETIDAIRMTQRAAWQPIVSARSGKTEDAFIAHLAVATSAGQLKVGSFARSERMAKWNEVLRIERARGDRARFAGFE